MKPRRSSLVTVGIAFAVLTGCTGDDEGGIEVAAVGRATVTEVVEAPASVQARATSTVTATGTGTLDRLDVVDGQRVRAGQTLAVVDSPGAQKQLTEAKTALAEAEAAAPGPTTYVDVSASQTAADTAATRAFTAARTAAEQVPEPRARAAALASVAAAQRQYSLAAAQARAAIRALNSGLGNVSAALASLSAAQRVQARLAVTAAQQAVDALTITAPIDGTIQLGGSTSGGSGTDLSSVLDQLPTDVRDQAATALGGQSAGTGSQTTTVPSRGMPVATGMPIVTIVDTSVLSLVAEVDETDVLLVRPGVPATAEFDAVPGASYPATVAAVDLTPTAASSGGVSYRVRLSLRGGTLAAGGTAPLPRPGMSAVTELRVRTAENAVSVPAAAVVHGDDSRDAVWVVDGGKAHRRPVTVGTQGEDVVQIAAGLRVGERVVVRGADQVTENQSL